MTDSSRGITLAHQGRMKRPRWNVAILDGDPRAEEALSEAIERAGGAVTTVADGIEDAIGVVFRTNPDVTVLAVGPGAQDGVEVAEGLTAAVACAVVLHTSRMDDAVLRRASAAGAMGFLSKPLRTADLVPTLDLAIARFKDIQRLRQQLADRKVIERAKGLLMARMGLSENQAFQLLRRTAMNRRLPMAHVARSVILIESSGDGRLSLLERGPGGGRPAAGAGAGRAADG
jgi:AmiR/NasT family two-component response regulator